MARTMSGKLMTAAERTSPGHAKAIFIPNHVRSSCPTGASELKVRSRMYPVTTGGRTSGRLTSTSTSDLARKGIRASMYPRKMPPGRDSSTTQNPTRQLLLTAAHSLDENQELDL